jgi:transposase-like protein
MGYNEPLNQEVQMKKRIQYPKEFKARVALEALKEVKTIVELSAEHEVHSTLLSLLFLWLKISVV